MIAIVVDSVERYKFVSRLIRSLDGRYQILMITSEPYAYLSSKRLKCHDWIILKSYGAFSHCQVAARVTENEINSDVMKSIEVLNEDISLDVAKRDYKCSLVSFIKAFERHGVTKCIMWNGQQLLCRAATKACKLLNIDTAYIEIANLPGKLFVDPCGVNALSSIAKDISVIDRLPEVDETMHRQWLEYYEACKQKPLPQSKTSLPGKSKSAINYFFKVLFPCVLRKKVNKVKIKNSASIDYINFVDHDFIESKEYIFLPLQVSGDTQIKLHSNYDNSAAIEYAAEDARKLGLHLIVKIHPAECSEEEISKILKLRDKLKFNISNANTTFLIKKAKKIVTINSTVGLEGLLYEKDTKAIGRCFYQSFDQTRLKKYIHQYLVDGIDYFSDDSIEYDVSEKVINA